MTPEVFVTNFNARFTGVSSTAARVAAAQEAIFRLAIVGHPLPGCPPPLSRSEARALSRVPPSDRPFAIWHVRRDPEMLAAIWARDVLRLPIRTVFTSAAKHRHSWFPRWLIGRMDAVIATSADAAAFFPGVAATVHHGVDTDAIAPAKDRQRAWRDLGFGGARGVATIGRVRADKGTDVFVDAMIGRLARDPDTTALVIGLARDREAAFLAGLKARVAAAGLSGRILFPGFIDNDRLGREVLPALSLVCNLARYEPFGVVPVEGMAAGTPFVCSDTGHYRALAADGSTGLIVPPGDAPAAARAIGDLLDDPERLEAMGRRARQSAVRDHSIAREADGVAAVYERLWAGEDLRVHRGPEPVTAKGASSPRRGSRNTSSPPGSPRR